MSGVWSLGHTHPGHTHLGHLATSRISSLLAAAVHRHHPLTILWRKERKKEGEGVHSEDSHIPVHTSGPHEAAIVVDTVLHCLVLAIIVDDEWLPTSTAAVPHGWREREG